MAALSISSFLSKWASLFATNSAREISEEDLRDFRQDIADSFLNTVDQAYSGVAGFKNGINTIAGLKAIVSSGLSLNIYVVFRDTGNGDVLRVYELVSGTDAEASPYVIRPDDYAATTNERVWKLASVVSEWVPWDFPSGAYPTATAASQQWYSDDDHDDEDGQLIAKDTLLISRAAGTGSANFIKKM